MTKQELDDFADIIHLAAIECRNMQDENHGRVPAYSPWANVGETEMVVALVSFPTWLKLVNVRYEHTKVYGQFPPVNVKECLAGYWPIDSSCDGHERNFLLNALAKRKWGVPGYVSPIDKTNYILQILKPVNDSPANGPCWHYPLAVGDVSDGKIVPVRIK